MGLAYPGPMLSYRSLSVVTTGATAVTSKSDIYRYYVYNASAGVRYLKIYDKATAPTTSDAPIETWPIPSGGGANASSDSPLLSLTAGLALRASTGVADSDAGAPAANDVVVNFGYRV